jgi:hypothetical protein
MTLRPGMSKVKKVVQASAAAAWELQIFDD